MDNHRAENRDTEGVGVLAGDGTDITGVLTEVVKEVVTGQVTDMNREVRAERRDLREEMAAVEAPETLLVRN